MKSLSLYIDKWYIVGAVIDEDGSHKLTLPNNEDRIWLYFYNNIGANKIEYGLEFKHNAIAGVLNYYTDIFKLIPASACKMYKMYGRPVEMRKIFEHAGIFADFKTNFKNQKTIPTFVSFSPDIKLEAQSVFLSLLKENIFDVKEFVANIDYLALEYALSKRCISNPTNILIANACNENLIYSVYSVGKTTFTLLKKEKLEGLGEDLRGRAIIEKVIDYVNSGTRFLSNDEEIKEEHLYLSRYVTDWLLSLDSTPKNQPTALGYVHFKKQKGNSHPVTVMKSDIDGRTSIIIEDIVRRMMSLIADSGLGIHDISNVLFIGDTFDNSEFKRILEQQLPLDEDCFLHFHESDLTSIVSIYQTLDSSLFDTAEADFAKKSEAEKQGAIRAMEARKAMERAQKQEQQEREKMLREKESERNFKQLLGMAESSEKKEELESALDFYKKALLLSPKNSYIAAKIDTLTELIAVIKSKKEQYGGYIKAANAAIDLQDWSEAESQGKLALGVMPKSEEASKIVKEASEMSQKFESIKSSLVKVDVFIEQKDFARANKELDAIELLGVKSPDIQSRRSIVNKYILGLKNRIIKLKQDIETASALKDYKSSINACNELISIDLSNATKWEKIKKDFEDKQKKVDEEELRLKELQDQIQLSHLSEDWLTLVKLCSSYLEIKEDLAVDNLKQKAKCKLKQKEIQTDFDAAAEAMNWKEVIDISDENPFLKELASNNRIIQQARDQIRKSKISSRRSNVLDVSNLSEQVDSQEISRPKKLRGPHRRRDEIKPITLLEDENKVEIEITKGKIKHPNLTHKKIIVESIEKKVGNESLPKKENSENKVLKRKFPRVPRSK